MPPREPVGVTLILAHPARAIIRQYSLAEGSTVQDALFLAAQEPEFAGVDLSQLAVGIFGRVVQRNELLLPGDRVELYRPLAEDPKTARRRRARAG